MMILEVAKALKDGKVPFAVAGGYAVALHGALRGTVDLDLVIQITQNSFTSLERVLAKLGLLSRLPINGGMVFSFREEYINQKNLIAWSFYHPQKPSWIVDILLTEDLKDQEIKNVSIHGVKVPVVGIKSLIKMKKKSGRPQDLADIEALKLIEKNKEEK